MKKNVFIILMIFLSSLAWGQDRFDEYKRKLDSLSVVLPGINENVSLNISGVALSDFISALAAEHNLNISVDNKLRDALVNNFYNAKVIDVLIFLARKFDLDFQFIGTIISISKFVHPPPVVEPYTPKEPNIVFYKKDTTVDFSLKNDSLHSIAQKLAALSGYNVVYEPGLEKRLINISLVKLPLKTAMEKLAYANALEVELSEDKIFTLSNLRKEEENKNTGNRTSRNNRSSSDNASSDEGGLQLDIRGDYISIEAINYPIHDLIEEVSNKMKVDFFIYSALKGEVSLFFNNLTYKDFLGLILNTTKYGYETKNGVYLIGERSLESIRSTVQYKFQYRTVSKLQNFIPGRLMENIEVKEFVELNSFIMTGNEKNIEELVSFFKSIDQPVPLVYIEMIIIDVNRSKSINTGITYGINESPSDVPTNGTLSPFNMELNPATINNIINSINGFGFINLGNVNENFFMNLNALEQNGNINIKSTPKLSTLNGHEAKISIGETTYYFEINNQVLNNTVSQNLLQSQQWKPLDADLTITITPFVSGDEQVTLDIMLDQNDFTDQVSENAPRGKTKRSFKSLIRVNNNEVVLMGGLERQESNKTGTGIPFLSRIPIIKWFFSNRVESERETKLNIFIKPTIIY